MKKTATCKNCTVEELLKKNLEEKIQHYKRVSKQIPSGLGPSIAEMLVDLMIKRQEMEIAERLLQRFREGSFCCPFLEFKDLRG